MGLAELLLVVPFCVVTVAACRNPNEGFRPPVAAASLRADAKEGASDSSLAKTATAPRIAPDEVGMATWYGGAFAGRKTANGERFDPTKYTAAHRKLPFGTWVEVRRVDTGRAVRVRINDRGPWGDDRRVVDLSLKAAQDLDMVREGSARIEIRIVSGP